jgi:hypothetical protein
MKDIFTIYTNMLGNFQKSQLRIEVKATEKILRDSLFDTPKLRQWFWLAQLETDLPSKLELGLTFSSWVLGVEIVNEVETANDNFLRLLLSKGIDGYHEWCWGDGWVQSRLYGISLLPLNLAQTLILVSLQNFVQQSRSNHS